MKWTKVNQKTGEPVKRTGYNFMQHDYVSGNFKIINNSFMERKLAWVLTCNGNEVGRFDTLKQAKERAEAVESLAEWI